MKADVLIVGAGIAGSSLAILLGRQGINVELFERGHFPREKACGEGIMPAGVGVLERLGVADMVGGVPFCGVRYHVGRKVAEGRFPTTAGMPSAGRGQRRWHLDRILFEVAVCTRGVSAHIDSAVERIHCENGRVSGVWAEGKLHRAALVVAADGAHSRIRQQLGLSTRPARKRFGVRAHFQLGPSCEQPPWVDVFVGPGYELYVTPLPEREILVAGLADSHALNEPLEQAFLRWRSSHRILAARLAGAKQTSELLSSALLAGRARAGVTLGVALLGDAACLLDPITGGGITQALLTAELLAEYVPAKLGTDEKWLWDFDRERLVLVRDFEIMTELVLWLSEHQQLGQWMLSMLNESPSLFSHFIGVSGGMKRFWSLGDFLLRTNKSVSFSENQTADRNWRRLSQFRQAIVNLLS